MTPLVILAVLVLCILGVLVLFQNLFGSSPIESVVEAVSPYQKKKYLFDTTSEFQLYKLLLELFGDRFHIFPQINYSHLIETTRMDWKNAGKYRSRIDKKSADFVLCDKQRVVPQLVIELDGSAHNLASKQKRDRFIDDLTRIVGLPILHLQTGNMEREYVREEVERAMTNK